MQADWNSGICYQRSQVAVAKVRDGSDRMISYLIDASTHKRLGNRKDGQPIDTGSL